ETRPYVAPGPENIRINHSAESEGEQLSVDNIGALPFINRHGEGVVFKVRDLPPLMLRRPGLGVERTAGNDEIPIVKGFGVIWNSAEVVNQIKAEANHFNG